jgi:hypothetical protein
MSARKRKTWPGRVFIGRDEHGKQRFYWVGRFPTKRERDDAIAKARTEKPWLATPPAQMTCEEWARRYLKRYERLNKSTSVDTARQALKPFRAEFGHRPIDSLEPVEAEDWADTMPGSQLPQVVALFNYAKSKRAIDFNPFGGLGGRSRGRGRADENPPTVKELQALLDGCDALGDYAQQMRDLVLFASYTLMRPGELYELRHPDVDVAANRIVVARRVYRGVVDLPKNNKAKMIALVPPARDILVRQPTRARDDGLVFVSKRGNRLSAPTLSLYWAQVKARAGLDFDFYLATKHYTAVSGAKIQTCIARRIAVEIVGDFPPPSLERAFKRSAAGAQKFDKQIGKTGKGRKAFTGLTKGAGLLTGALGVGGLTTAIKASFDEMADGPEGRRADRRGPEVDEGRGERHRRPGRQARDGADEQERRRRRSHQVRARTSSSRSPTSATGSARATRSSTRRRAPCST